MEPPRLSRAVFDRAAERRGDDAWLAQAWQRARVVLVSPEGLTPVQDGTFRLALADPLDGVRRFLGLVGDVPYFSVTAPAESTWADLRMVGQFADDLDAGLLTAAVGLEQWHQRHTHCAQCGAATVERQAGWIRTCPEDGSDHFPRTDPAVIMLVRDDKDRVLLGRNANWPAGRFSTLAGFVEPGESLEAAVEREVFEEAGVRITDVEYVASQPWPFPSSLMLGFTARLDGPDDITVDGSELTDARWFTRDEVRQAVEWTDAASRGQRVTDKGDAVLRGVSPVLSISRYLLDCWLS